MALDGIFIYSILNELNDTLLGGRVEKINQPEKDEIILTIKNRRKSYRLSISASSVYPKIHITGINKINPKKAPMFCMVLRKHISSAKLINISQLDMDRVIFMDFESSDEMGFNSIYTLVVEIMGRHSNITLIRKRDNIIMDSIKHLTPEINSVRSVYPGIQYMLPPSSSKLNPLDFSLETFEKFVSDNSIKFNEKFFSTVFTGISNIFSMELYESFSRKNDTTSSSWVNAVFDFFTPIYIDIKNDRFHFSSYVKDGKIKDFYCLRLYNIYNEDYKSYDSPSKLLEEFYFQKDKTDRLNNKSSDLHKLINVNLERCEKKRKILTKNIEEARTKDKYRILGELLTSNIYAVKKGDQSIRVQNFYSSKSEYIDIKLDKNKTPSENIQTYFKKYNKLKKTEKAALNQLKLTHEEIEYLNSVLASIRTADSYEDIEEIKRELMESGYIRYKKSNKLKNSGHSKPLKFISSDGIEIYVGKNNIQNDHLTLKFADKRDIWLHAKNIPGSHVIIKNFGNIPDRTLEEAASLSAYYSKSRDSSKVAVDYTEVKNVHKPNGSRPGMVIYYTNRTIYVPPEKPDLVQVQ
ncbi:MAG: NFACT family protein [Clostridium sp.]|uniref:Rqc2 family fibronectin-binding protein n=1 Tax=Clostridium sp. TaxID=1506 RepID=UPI0025C0F80D|nr:NFACT RNA binding domain-containing protein [Clostridium sp.]MCH3964172.1 NFACT family protein [Clostridium sp.]MCI1715353.1 NFACT family protein [Clostridium sp.]MCI1799856.1 NFACT family protein [Clostridium sp.]MCI1813536.1 NFACT family protein [Clostridium sp.]MCI1870674.1 NFACT family protein [Clostridium sp.]